MLHVDMKFAMLACTWCTRRLLGGWGNSVKPLGLAAQKSFSVEYLSHLPGGSKRLVTVLDLHFVQFWIAAWWLAVDFVLRVQITTSSITLNDYDSSARTYSAKAWS